MLGRHVPRKPRPSGRGQGAQYKRRLPYREAPPLGQEASLYTLHRKR